MIDPVDDNEDPKEINEVDPISDEEKPKENDNQECPHCPQYKDLVKD